MTSEYSSGCAIGRFGANSLSEFLQQMIRVARILRLFALPAATDNVRVMSAKDHPNNAPGVPMKFPPAFERLQIKYMNPMVKRISRFMPAWR